MRLPAPEDLPKVSFRRIDDDLSKPVVGLSDTLARSFGCTCVQNKLVLGLKRSPDCDGSDFERPVHYIRHTGKPQVLLAVGSSDVWPQRRWRTTCYVKSSMTWTSKVRSMTFRFSAKLMLSRL
jgi:hypothetical protein